MAKRKEPTDEEIQEICNWDFFLIDFVRVLKDDRDLDLDSNFRCSTSLYIKPDKINKNKHIQETVDFFKSIKKEQTFSFYEMPDLFKSFYFDELHVERFGKSHDELERSWQFLEEHHKKASPFLNEIEMEMNAADKRYREDTKTKKYLVNYFGIKDSRFKHFLDSFALLNELMPLQTIPRQQFIAFFNGLEEYKNNLFDLKNPEYVYEYDAVDVVDGKRVCWIEKEIKHRFLIPMSRVKIKSTSYSDIEKVLSIRNSLWDIIYPQNKRDIKEYTFNNPFQHPLHDFLFSLLLEYDRELLVRNIANICDCCGDLFKHKKAKKYCSYLSEGKDCGKKYRNYTDYYKHRKKRQHSSKKNMSEYRTLLKKHGISSK